MQLSLYDADYGGGGGRLRSEVEVFGGSGKV